MSNSRLVAYLFLTMIAALPLAVALGQQAMTTEIVSKSYSSGYFPLAGSYVEYEVRLTNTDDAHMEDESLQVSLMSTSNRTHSSATYSITLEMGGRKTLFLGPFKIEDEGGYRLLLGMKGAPLNEIDSFVAYRQDAIQAAVVAVPLIAAGSGIVGFLLYRKGRCRSV